MIDTRETHWASKWSYCRRRAYKRHRTRCTHWHGKRSGRKPLLMMWLLHLAISVCITPRIIPAVVAMEAIIARVFITPIRRGEAIVVPAGSMIPTATISTGRFSRRLIWRHWLIMSHLMQLWRCRWGRLHWSTIGKWTSVANAPAATVSTLFHWFLTKRSMVCRGIRMWNANSRFGWWGICNYQPLQKKNNDPIA